MKRQIVGLSLLAGGASIGLAGARRMRQVAEDAASLAPGRFLVAGGARLHYLEDGEGAPVVLIHGFGGSAFSWRYVMPLLAADHRVIAIDLPGFGYSDRSSTLDLSQAAQAQRVIHAMDVLGITRATVVGHSMGAAIAERLAIANPLRVERLVLAAPVDAGVQSPMARQSAWVRNAAAGAMRAAGQAPPIVRTMVGRGLRGMAEDPAWVTREVVNGYVEPLIIPGTAACISRMARDTGREPLAELDRIQAPTLVIAGSNDSVIPAAGTKAMADRIPGAKYAVFEGAGHLLVEERAEALVEEMLAFATGHAVQPA